MLFWQRENITRAPAYGPVSPVVRSRKEIEDAEKLFRNEVARVVNTIYLKDSETAVKVVNGLMAQYGSLVARGLPTTAFEENVKKTLERRVELVAQHKNVSRKRLEYQESIKDIGKVDLKELSDVVAARMGRDNDRWKYDRDPYGDQNAIKERTEYQKKVDAIKMGSDRTVYTMPVGKEKLDGGYLLGSNFVDLLHEANKQVSTDLLQNSKQLNSLVTTGGLLPPQSALSSVGNAALDGLERTATAGCNAFERLSKAIGKGIWSQSDIVDNAQLKKHYAKRNLEISNLFRNISPDKSKNSKLMERCKAILDAAEDENGFIDAESFRKITDMLNKEAKESDVENSKKIDEYTKRINDLNDKVLETAKSQTMDSDQMAKWRLLQLALLITPFMGLSVMGPVLNVFSGVFMHAGGVGQGLASLLTSEYTGPFGEICELLHLDEAVKWLLCDMPGISNVVDVVDSVISSDIVQGTLGGAVVPLASSPLVPLLIAGVFSIFRGAKELDHLKFSDQFKEHDKEMQKEFDKMLKEVNEAETFPEERVKEFVKNKFDTLERAHLKKYVAQGFAERVAAIQDSGGDVESFVKQLMGDGFLHAMQAYQSTDAVYGTVSKVFDDYGNVSVGDLMKFLDKSPDSENFLDRSLLFYSLEKDARRNNPSGDEVDLQKVLTRLTDMQHTTRAKKLIAEEKEFAKEEYILRLASALYVDFRNVPDFDDSETDPDKREANQKARTAEIKKLEKEIKEEEVNFFKKDQHGKESLKTHLLPPSANSIKNREFVPLYSPPPITVGAG